MGLRKEKVEGFKKLLLTRRDEVQKQISKTTHEYVEKDEMLADAVDQAAAETDLNMAMQMKNRDREIIVQIDEALRRLEAGSFGECESCGEDIAEARIKAFPFTTLCIDCKSQQESEGLRFPGRA